MTIFFPWLIQRRAGPSINLDEIIVIPTATVAQCTGLSPKSVQRKFPITELSKQKQGVILKTLRKYVTRAKMADAIAAAENKLDEIETGGLIWSALPTARRRFLEAIHRDARHEDEAAIPAFLAAREKSTEVVASVSRFLAWKVESKGEETRNLANVRRNPGETSKFNNPQSSIINQIAERGAFECNGSALSRTKLALMGVAPR